MILFAILTVILLVLIIVAVVVISIGGAAFIVVFGDLIVCIAIIALIMRGLIKRRRNKRS